MSDDQQTIDLFSDEWNNKQFSAKTQETKTIASPVKEPIKSIIPAANTSPELKKQQNQKQPSLKKQYSDLKVDDQMEVDLSNSFSKLNIADESPYVQDYETPVQMSIYMQRQEPNQVYVSPPASPPPPPLSLPPAPPKFPPKATSNFSSEKKTNHVDLSTVALDQSLNKSGNQKQKPPPKTFFTKKKQSSLQSSSVNSNKTGMNDSTLGFDVPAATKLVHADLKSSTNSGSSSEAVHNNRKSVKAIERIQIQNNTNQVVFYLSDFTSIKKVISEPYLEYLEKFFFYNFNVLLPMHINQILDNNPGSKIYVQIYFDFIKSKHPQKLLQFLEKSNFKTQQQKVQTTEAPKNLIKQKLETYKNIVINTIYSGKDMVQNAVKKIKGETSTPVRILQRVFSKQIEIAQKQQKARERFQSLTGNKNIHVSVYEKGGSDIKMHVLMCLRWLLGFELTIQSIKQRLSNADQVQKQKLEFLINQFTIEKQKQQNQKIKSLQAKIISIYSS